MMEPKEHTLLMDHDYDGIRELDNRLPPWWLYMFYITILWGLLYLAYYHVLNIGDSSVESYLKEMNPSRVETAKKASLSMGYRSPFYSTDGDRTPLEKIKLQIEMAKQVSAGQGLSQLIGGGTGEVSFDDLILAAMQMATPENRDKLKNAFPDLYLAYQGSSSLPPGATATSDVKTPDIEITPLSDQTSLTAGKKVFEINCVTCHGKMGEGGIGPNLTDDYYLHGAGMTNTYKTINQGVPAKGMISWRGILKDDQIKQVASYILTIHGTNPPNPKAPQGEKVQPVQ